MIDRLAVAGQGEGIDGLLGYLVRLLVEEGTPVVTSDGAYPTFNFHVRHIPACPVPSPRSAAHSSGGSLHHTVVAAATGAAAAAADYGGGPPSS
jgi:histidinol-phosphate/aromatic aminotransferase/cobyric acid decarboxylase-like protein